VESGGSGIRIIRTLKQTVMKRERQYLELTYVWLDKRRKKVIDKLELKETRLVNQMFHEYEMECVEVRVKYHIGTREEFEHFLIS